MHGRLRTSLKIRHGSFSPTFGNPILYCVDNHWMQSPAEVFGCEEVFPETPYNPIWQAAAASNDSAVIWLHVCTAASFRELPASTWHLPSQPQSRFVFTVLVSYTRIIWHPNAYSRLYLPASSLNSPTRFTSHPGLPADPSSSSAKLGRQEGVCKVEDLCPRVRMWSSSWTKCKLTAFCGPMSRSLKM